MELVEKLLKGDKKACAKLITIVENSAPEAEVVLSKIYPYTGRAYIIGLTGPPGVGKSTLVDKIAKELRRRGKTIGIIAIDPSSPFTGGAFLGDRIRMQDRCTDEGVFIRSMATRGHLGGLARATIDAVKILDASGKDFIVIETVGAGQAEVDIVRVADTVVVILAPGLGDEIQAIKAGIIEIADIIVVNKADLPGADKTVIQLESVLKLNQSLSLRAWRVPVIKTIAETNIGILELLDAIEKHEKYLKETKLFEENRKQRCRSEILEYVYRKLSDYILKKLDEGEIEKLVEEVMLRRIAPNIAANKIFERLKEV
jgi:LAO/AO transport system kinase